MTRISDDGSVIYIDNNSDVVDASVQEVRSSVDYQLNSTTKNLTLTGSSDGEIKGNYLVYGYPDKWELDYVQGNEGSLLDDNQKIYQFTNDCGIVLEVI